MKIFKLIIFWVLAVIITLSAAIYQRTTGPTYPKKAEVKFSDITYNFKLKRSQEIGEPCDISLNVDGNKDITGTVFYKRYKIDETWNEVELSETTIDEEKVLSAVLPEQPEAGKLEYFIKLNKGSETQFIEQKHPIVIRFKGAVPAYILAPHIFFMFLTMLFASITAIFVIAKDNKNSRRYGYLSFFTLFIGGMILGPIVQKFAFSEFWTGIPFGWDLTDNKTLIAFAAWTIAAALNFKKQRPIAFLIATLVLYAIYTIPHSAFGSELNYETGKVTQGFIQSLLSIF